MRFNLASKGVDRPDLAAGLLFVTAGIAFLWFGSSYRIGTSAAMGPGYLPRVVAMALIVLGLVTTARAAFAGRRRIEGFGWYPLAIVLVALVLFAVLVDRAGILAACAVSIWAVTYADRNYNWRLRLAITFVLTAGATLIFVGLVGLPIRVLPW